MSAPAVRQVQEAGPAALQLCQPRRAIWLAHRVLDHKLSFEDALKEAETVGLKLPALSDKAKDYIERKKGR